jgi:hypothetical protein
MSLRQWSTSAERLRLQQSLLEARFVLDIMPLHLESDSSDDDDSSSLSSVSSTSNNSSSACSEDEMDELVEETLDNLVGAANLVHGVTSKMKQSSLAK